MILTARDIAEITRLLDESHFSELRLEIGEFKLRISRGGAAPRNDYDDEPEFARAPAQAGASGDDAQGPRLRGDSGPGTGEVDVPSPLLGNFYHSPRPGDPPFVVPGDTVTEDSTIGIVEVMKLMNPIRAGVAGTVVAYLAQNGTAVEKGQPLIRIGNAG
jgi:acetyl-CoA carboxylase biotin carboxyl carrier protein